MGSSSPVPGCRIRTFHHRPDRLRIDPHIAVAERVEASRSRLPGPGPTKSTYLVRPRRQSAMTTQHRRERTGANPKASSSRPSRRDPFQIVDDVAAAGRSRIVHSEAKGHVGAEEWLPGQARDDDASGFAAILLRRCRHRSLRIPDGTVLPTEPLRDVSISWVARRAVTPASTGRRGGWSPRRSRAPPTG